MSPTRSPLLALQAHVGGTPVKLAHVAADYAPALTAVARLLTRAAAAGAWERSDALRLQMLSDECDS